MERVTSLGNGTINIARVCVCHGRCHCHRRRHCHQQFRPSLMAILICTT